MQPQLPVTQRLVPPPELAGGLPQQDLAQADDQPRLLGQGQELGRGQEGRLPPLPPDQGLEPGQAAVLQPHDGLVVQAELPRLHGVVQVLLFLEAAAPRRVAEGIVDLVASTAPLLRPEHGHVRLPDDSLGRGLLRLLSVGQPQGHAHAGLEPELGPLHAHGLVEGPDQPLRRDRRLLPVLQLLQQDGELVPAEAGHRVLVPDVRLQPAGHPGQHPVADGVAQAVVHLLEMVQVQEEDAQPATVPLGPGQGLSQPVLEELPVREAGELVVQGAPLQLALHPDPLGDVVDDGLDAPIVAEQDRDAVHLHRPLLPVRPDHAVAPGAQLPEPPRLLDLLQAILGLGTVLGVEELEDALAQQLLGIADPQQPQRGPVRILDDAVHVHHDGHGRQLVQAPLLLPVAQQPLAQPAGAQGDGDEDDGGAPDHQPVGGVLQPAMDDHLEERQRRHRTHGRRRRALPAPVIGEEEDGDEGQDPDEPGVLLHRVRPQEADQPRHHQRHDADDQRPGRGPAPARMHRPDPGAGPVDPHGLPGAGVGWWRFTGSPCPTGRPPATPRAARDPPGALRPRPRSRRPPA